MDFRQLQYLSEVVKHQSVTKAADSLYISQSALSHYIRKAEEELGVRIFDRSTNPITLTEAGKCYMESAQRILLENERLTKELRDITNHMSGTLSIGTSVDRCSYMMPGLLPSFKEIYPGIKVNVVVGSGNMLRDMLHNGEIDLLLLPDLPDDNKKGLISDVLYTEEMLLVAAKGYIPEEMRVGGHHIIQPRDMATFPFYLQELGHVNRNYCDKLFQKTHIKPEILQEFSSNITCYRMAATGTGVTIIPFMTAKLANAGQEVELFSIGDPPLLWDVHLYYRKDAYLGLPEKKLISLARDIFSREIRSPAHMDAI